MLIGGLKNHLNAELVDLDNRQVCPEIANLTAVMDEPWAALVDGNLITCGDYDCLTYNFEQNAWDEGPELSLDDLPISGTANVEIDGTWYLMGGRDGSNGTLVFQDGVFSRGHPLPYEATDACAVEVNATHFVFIGGDDYFGRAYLVEPKEWLWTRLPDSVYPHETSACARVGSEVFVVGGREYFASQTTEVLNLETLEWTLLPAVPIVDSILAASVVREEETFLLLGGENTSFQPLDTVYQFDVAKKAWRLLNKRLGRPRASGAAVKIPKNMIQC